jgi:hypothetical protein
MADWRWPMVDWWGGVRASLSRNVAEIRMCLAPLCVEVLFFSMKDYLVFLIFVLIGIVLLCVSFLFLLPLVAGLVALLIFHWKKRKRLLLCVTLCVTSFGILVALLFGSMLLAWGLASEEWERSGFEKQKPATRQELEAHLHLVRKVKEPVFTNLFMSIFFSWDPDKHTYIGSGTNYTPHSGDQYYRYEVLGLMPIDAVVDRGDKVVLLFPSFDY